MSFLLACPVCGPRDVYEFRWGGVPAPRPAPGAAREDWVRYLYLRDNEAGLQTEWWYHRLGCRRWFLAARDTRTNEVTRSDWPPAMPPPAATARTEREPHPPST
jgi:sarcosine oxidase subunit delta